MNIVKLIKNNSGSDKFILTRTVPDQTYYLVPTILWVELLDSQDILNDIVTGDLIVNNGIEDLNAEQGLILLRNFQEIRFSYNKLINGQTIEIPEQQQMIVHNMITLEDDSVLIIQEDLVII